MKKILLAISFFATSAFAAPYPVSPAADVIELLPQSQIRFHPDIYEQAVDLLWEHARSYPLNFDSESDLERAKHDIQLLWTAQQTLGAEFPDSMLDHARIAVMAHNFDMAGAAESASHYYQKMLEQFPKSGGLALEYAIFLGNSNQIEPARKYFQQALDNNAKRAYWGLALTYLPAQPTEALQYLAEYQKYFPKDENVQPLMEALRQGNIEVKELK